MSTFHVAGDDTERKLWYCEMEIDAGPSFTPFVRLALARFQPMSLDGAHLSRVVLADFVQLTANRSASLTRPKKDAKTLNVAVSGQSYSLLNNAAGPSVVEVSLEQRRKDTDPNKADELAFDQIAGSTVALTPSAGPAGTTVWTGQITIPKELPDRLRVIIREFEKFGSTAAGRRLVYADAIEIEH